jgi:hypothetical protein
MRFLRRLASLGDLLITIFLTIIHLGLGTVYFYLRYTSHHLSQIIHPAILPLTLQGGTTNTFPLVTGQKTKGFNFPWLTELKF